MKIFTVAIHAGSLPPHGAHRAPRSIHGDWHIFRKSSPVRNVDVTM